MATIGFNLLALSLREVRLYVVAWSRCTSAFSLFPHQLDGASRRPYCIQVPEAGLPEPFSGTFHQLLRPHRSYCYRPEIKLFLVHVAQYWLISLMAGVKFGGQRISRDYLPSRCSLTHNQAKYFSLLCPGLWCLTSSAAIAHRSTFTPFQICL